MTQQFRLWALIAGAALFIGVYLSLRLFTNLSPDKVLGSELSILFFWKLIRAFIGSVATDRHLRVAQVLLSVPIGLFGLAAFLNAWPTTSQYAPWVLLGSAIFYFGISRPYVRKLPRHAN